MANKKNISLIENTYKLEITQKEVSYLLEKTYEIHQEEYKYFKESKDFSETLFSRNLVILDMILEKNYLLNDLTRNFIELLDC